MLCIDAERECLHLYFCRINLQNRPTYLHKRNHSVDNKGLPCFGTIFA